MEHKEQIRKAFSDPEFCEVANGLLSKVGSNDVIRVALELLGRAR